MPHKDPQAHKAYQAAYRAKHRAHRRELHTAWREKNRKAWEDYQAEYRKKHAEKKAADAAAWRKKYPERFRQSNEQWRLNNRDYLLQKKKEWAHTRGKLPEFVAKRRAHYQANRETYCKKAAAYAKKNPHVPSAANARRRSRIALTIGFPEQIAEFMATVRNRKHVRCYFCKERVAGSKVHFDHIVPLSKGGGHTISNLCAACPRCNLTKQAKLLGDWQPDVQSVLPL